MELKIKIIHENKDRVLKLISELVDAEYEVLGVGQDTDSKKPIDIAKSKPNFSLPYAGETHHSLGSKLNDKVRTESVFYQSGSRSDILRKNGFIPDEYMAEPTVRESSIGSWFMFNSFFASKSVMRGLSNLLIETKNNVFIDEFLQEFFQSSKARGLLTYRGFPKEKEKRQHASSNIQKMRYFILSPLEEMGFIKINQTDGKREKIFITPAGAKFSLLENPRLDLNDNQLLSNEEIKFLTFYLKEIDAQGYKEYTILQEFLDYLVEKSKVKSVTHIEVVSWFANNPKIIDYLYSNSRAKKNNLSKDSDFFKKQLSGVASAFASGKVAILRELRVINDKRNDYSVIGGL